MLLSKKSNSPVRTVYALLCVLLWRNKFSVLGFCMLCSLVVNQAVVAAPRIGCDAPKYNFGKMIGQDEMVHEFLLWNRGDEPVKISSIKNCCGTQSSIVPMEILPGSNAVCKTIFTTRNRYGEQDKQILIASNDRKNPYYELRMTGTLLKPVEYAPRLVRLDGLLPNSEIDQVITVTNLLEQPVALLSVESTVPALTAEIVGEVDDAARSWTIKLTATDVLKVGKLSGQVLLDLSSGRVSVPVMGRVNPLVQVVPETVRFSSTSKEPVSRLVMLRRQDGSDFKILRTTLLHAEGSIEADRLAVGKWKVAIRVKPELIKSGALLQVETNCDGQTMVNIPLQVD